MKAIACPSLLPFNIIDPLDSLSLSIIMYIVILRYVRCPMLYNSPGNLYLLTGKVK